MSQPVDDYRNRFLNGPIGRDIVERWETRVVPLGLLDRVGGMQYLRKYGKGIGVPKLIGLARMAEKKNLPDMAYVFWERAYILSSKDALQNAGVVSTSKGSDGDEIVHIPEFPENLQCGRTVPMQPVDAKNERDFYVKAENYWGQPKRDGEKLIVFSVLYMQAYQSRTLKVGSAPSVLFEDALCYVAGVHGAFILEGEIYWVDAEGKEHQSEATCRAYNLEFAVRKYGIDVSLADEPVIEAPKMRFTAFQCLYADDFGGSLLEQTAKDRINIADYFMVFLAEYAPDIFVRMVTAKTEAEKALLCDTQKFEGREGECWYEVNGTYISGKNQHSPELLVRTKYLSDPTEYIITGISPTSADGHFIGGFDVSDLNGKPVGSVGTGYSRADQLEILKRFADSASKGYQLRVLIVSQGLTNYGKLKFGRFVGWPADPQNNQFELIREDK